MERKFPKKLPKPLQAPRPAAAVPANLSRSIQEETKLPQIQIRKQEILPKALLTEKMPSKKPAIRKAPTDLSPESEIQILKTKIKKNAEVIPTQTIKSLFSTYTKNKLEFLSLKSEQKSIRSSVSKLELFQGFVINEIEFYMARGQEPQELQELQELQEPDYTYEQLLELGEQIGKVSQGFAAETLGRMQTSAVSLSSQCSICLSPMEPGEQALVLDPCSHPYHGECIKSWLSEHKTCPLCLQEVIFR